MEIPFSDFMKLDLRVGEVEEATQVPKSTNLLKLIVDFGSEKRQAVAGLLQHYKPEDLVGKKFVFQGQDKNGIALIPFIIGLVLRIIVMTIANLIVLPAFDLTIAI